MKKFPEFRQKLGEGYFSLDLPQKVDPAEVDRALRQYRDLRTRIAQKPVANLTTTIAYNQTLKD